MLRTAAERRVLLAAWQSNPKNRGREPPVEIFAPGLKAPITPTRAQVREVQAVLKRNNDELVRLQANEMNLLLPLMKQAEKELGAQLKDWLHRTPDGELRWSAWKYQAAQLQLHAGATALEHALGLRLHDGGGKAQKLALEHLVHEVSRFSTIFKDVETLPPLRLNFAALMASGRAARVARYENSAHRYSWGKKNGVWQDMQKRLAIDILKGASVSETIDRLQAQGGPRGLVSLSGKIGEENAVVELIPEGLFARYRFWAERVVRTELSAAYGSQMLSGLFAAREILPDLQHRWTTDGGGCPHICRSMDGQVVPLGDSFLAGDGALCDHEPAHPNCCCRTGPWRAHWALLLDSLGVTD